MDLEEPRLRQLKTGGSFYFIEIMHESDLV